MGQSQSEEPQFEKSQPSNPEKSVNIIVPSQKYEYMPIESFLMRYDDEFVCWVMDNIGVLRSIFKIEKLQHNEISHFDFGKHEMLLSFENVWQIKSNIKIISTAFIDRYNIYIFHFIDGTAVMILNDILYYMCFEDCPDETFEKMKKERKCRDRKTILKGKLSQDEFEDKLK